MDKNADMVVVVSEKNSEDRKPEDKPVANEIGVQADEIEAEDNVKGKHLDGNLKWMERLEFAKRVVGDGYSLVENDVVVSLDKKNQPSGQLVL